METLNLFNINFNSNENEFLNLAYGCRDDAAVLNEFDANGVSILSFMKYAFADRVMLVYRKQFMHMQEFFFKPLQYLLATYFIDYVSGDFNCNLLEVSRSNFLDIFTDHVQIVNKPTYICIYLIFDKSFLYQENFNRRIFHSCNC